MTETPTNDLTFQQWRQDMLLPADHVTIVLKLHVEKGRLHSWGTNLVDTITGDQLGMRAGGFGAPTPPLLTEVVLSRLLDDVLDWAGPFPTLP